MSGSKLVVGPGAVSNECSVGTGLGVLVVLLLQCSLREHSFGEEFSDGLSGLCMRQQNNCSLCLTLGAAVFILCHGGVRSFADACHVIHTHCDTFTG